MSHLLSPARSLRIPVTPAVLRREDRVAFTGGHCPTSGAWAPAFSPSTPVVLHRGELMPPLDGCAVEWRYAASPIPSIAELG